MKFFLGTAGWTVPKQHAPLFTAPVEGTKPSHLERYATRLCCVEINSSFYRPHRQATWERWAQTTPAHFRFAVKMPKAVTHTAKLVNTGSAMLEFFDAVCGLGIKLGPVLVQLPPKLSFEEGIAQEFFTTLRELHAGAVVLEPRHPSWFASAPDRLLRSFEVARVAPHLLLELRRHLAPNLCRPSTTLRKNNAASRRNPSGDLGRLRQHRPRLRHRQRPPT
jgi:uncharacterized protein YecE (DUF72 family)